MCNALSCPSLLPAILFLLKRSDASALETASPDNVAANDPAQAAVAPSPKDKQYLLLALEMVSGFLFGSGLVVAGMVNPAKVYADAHVHLTTIIPFLGPFILICPPRRVRATILLPNSHNRPTWFLIFLQVRPLSGFRHGWCHRSCLSRISIYHPSGNSLRKQDNV
jgi:hypothetical protein